MAFKVSAYSSPTRKVARWVIGRLELDASGRQNGAKTYNQALCFDETHCTGVACISGVRLEKKIHVAFQTRQSKMVNSTPTAVQGT